MRAHDRPESPRTHPRESSFLTLLSGWAQQGVQSYFATQRILVDLAMRQNTSVMHALKERLGDPHHSPAAVLTDFAGEGVTNLIEAQKVLLDLGQKQHDILLTGVQDRIGSSAAATALTNLLRHSVDTAIELQQEFLNLAGKQTHAWMQDAKGGKPPKGTAIVDTARQAVEHFIHAEKRFLDAVAKEVATAAKGKPADGTPKKIKATELTELGRRAIESFIEAQKQLVDVAGRQMNANLKTASRSVDLLKPLPLLPLADWTRAGVQSFVDAQKSLMNAVTKPAARTAPLGRKKTARRTRPPKPMQRQREPKPVVQPAV